MELTLHLNARFQPIHRFELEDAIQEIMERNNMGEVTGGGTLQKPDGEIESCDIEIHMNSDSLDGVEDLSGIIKAMGVPKGSFLSSSEPEVNIEVGTLEGLAIYCNGTDLPDEVYKECDINYAIQKMEEAIEGIGRMYSYWEGANDTALYFYGTSYEEMKQRIEPFCNEYPLCQKSRIEKIA